VRQNPHRFLLIVFTLVLVGLGSHYVIPVGMFIVRCISGEEVYQFTIQVIRLVEKYGFRVVRNATDNKKTNQYMVEKMGGTGEMEYCVPNPCPLEGEDRPLF